jgi:hypothetical protein
MYAIKCTRNNTYYSVFKDESGWKLHAFSELSKNVIIKNSFREIISLYLNIVIRIPLWADFGEPSLFKGLRKGYVPVILTKSRLEELTFLKLK